MADRHTVWPYDGIIAAAYDHYFGSEPYWDQAFYERRLRDHGGRALELACGSGRLLLPLLRDGIEVEGLDTSADMLSILHAKAGRLGLSPVTYQRPMQSIDLPGRFRSVFVPAGSFGMLVGDVEIDATLAGCHAALVPGGKLLLPLSTASPVLTNHWQLRREVDVPSHAAHLRVFEQWHATADTHISCWVLRYEIEADGQPMQRLQRDHLLRRHAPDDFAARLVAAGFAQVTTHRGYADSPSDDVTDDLVFIAQRAD
jgi:SAM-dependent methyltransferase